MKNLLFIFIILVVFFSGCSVLKETFTAPPDWTPTQEDWSRAESVIAQVPYNSERDITITEKR